MSRRFKLSPAATTSPAASTAIMSTAVHGNVPSSRKVWPVMCTYTDQLRQDGTKLGTDNKAAVTAAAAAALMGSSIFVDHTSARPYTNAAPATAGANAA